MLYALNSKTSYENFEAVCPHCKKNNVFNRVGDLDGATEIDYREVTCLHAECRREFAINGDSADPAFAQVFFRAYDLVPRKEFGDAIVTIARSYEMFFEHFLSESLVWKPLVANGYDESDEANAAAEQLMSTTRGWPFMKMRNALMSVVVRLPISSVAEGAKVISALPQLVRVPEAQAVASVTNRVVRDALHRLLKSRISAVRNKVVHKNGYRPTPAEATELFEEARDVIWDMAEELDVRFDSLLTITSS